MITKLTQRKQRQNNKQNNITWIFVIYAIYTIFRVYWKYSFYIFGVLRVSITTLTRELQRQGRQFFISQVLSLFLFKGNHISFLNDKQMKLWITWILWIITLCIYIFTHMYINALQTWCIHKYILNIHTKVQIESKAALEKPL